LPVVLVTFTACGESRPCTEEEAENRDTVDCSSEVELETYTANSEDTVTVTQRWDSGKSLHLEGAIRELNVVEGDGNEVEITYRAQVELADGRPQSFVRETMDQLEVNFETRGDDLVFEATHPGTKAELGAIVTVAIPMEFDAELSIQKFIAPGDVAIEYLGQARGLDVDMEAIGFDLSVQDSGALRTVRLNAAGNIDTVNFGDPKLEQVVINSEDGNVVTGFDVVPREHARIITGKLEDGNLKDTGGNIRVSVPADGDFSLATYTKNRARFTGASGCARTEIADDIQTLDCGDGDVDGLLTFSIKSSSNIDIDVE
jgi:hypothetical protein